MIAKISGLYCSHALDSRNRISLPAGSFDSLIPHRLPVIGYLSGWSPNDAPEYLNYFRQGLAETGYVEGRNVAIEYRYAAGRFEDVAKLVDDLVRRQVNVIAIPNTTQSAITAKAANTNHSDSLFTRIQSG